MNHRVLELLFSVFFVSVVNNVKFIEFRVHIHKFG